MYVFLIVTQNSLQLTFFFLYIKVCISYERNRTNKRSDDVNRKSINGYK